MSSNKNIDSPDQSLRSTTRHTSLVQSIHEFGSGSKSKDLMLPKVDFVNETDFKKDPRCFVCKMEFSQRNRQHHCRMCANSCCSLCSENTINKQRVCDICFLKASQLAAENKRRKVLQTMKDQGKKLKRHIEQAKLKKEELEKEYIIQEEKAKEDVKTIEKETESYRIKYTQKAQEKVSQEEKLNEIKHFLQNLNDLKDQILMQLQDQEQEIRAYDTNLYLKEQELNDRKTQLMRLKHQKEDLENSSTRVVSDNIVETPTLQPIQQQEESQQMYNSNIDIDEMMNFLGEEKQDKQEKKKK